MGGILINRVFLILEYTPRGGWPRRGHLISQSDFFLVHFFGPPILSTQSGRCKICVPKHEKTSSKLIFSLKNTRRKRMFQYAFPLRKTEPKIVTTTYYRLQTDIGRTWIFKALLHNSPFGATRLHLSHGGCGPAATIEGLLLLYPLISILQSPHSRRKMERCPVRT